MNENSTPVLDPHSAPPHHRGAPEGNKNAARKVTEVNLRDPSNEPLHLKMLNRFFKLVMRKYGITDKHDEEALCNALAQVERDIVFPPEQMAALMKQLM
jgi:hypothetical protein